MQSAGLNTFRMKVRAFLLDLPVFHKILIANTALASVSVIVLLWMTRHMLELSNSLLLGLIGVGVLTVGISLGLNFVILRAALSSINPLVNTVEQVRRGNASARFKRSFFGDPDLARLGDTLNSLLDTVQLQRRELEAHLSRMKALSAGIVRAQEEERKRIALELHDEASQSLTAIIVGLRVVEQVDDLHEVKQRSAELRGLTADTLDALHRLIVELRPSLLDDVGLIPALRYHVEEFGHRFNLFPQISAVGFEHRLPIELESVLYRIVQEALTNVARHAQATHVWIRLERLSKEVHASITDNGQGFEQALDGTVPHNRGLGLIGMQERATVVGGTCHITSAPKGGTTVVASIPLLVDSEGTSKGTAYEQDPLVARR